MSDARLLEVGPRSGLDVRLFKFTHAAQIGSQNLRICLWNIRPAICVLLRR
jgi:hypothetical protein